MNIARSALTILFASCLLVDAGLAQSEDAVFVPTVTEIASMTVSNSVIDMDLVGPVGPTSLSAINAAGTNGGGNIKNIVLTPNKAAVGVYDKSVSCGRALALDQTLGLVLVDPPAGVFDAFDARIDLGQASTEFGIAVGDWLNTMVLSFWSGTIMVAEISSTSFDKCGAKFFQMTGGTFDRVDVRAWHPVGNWVIPELWVEKAVGPTSVAEVPAMTVKHSMIDMDMVGPAGRTTLAAINAAGSNGGANIKNIHLLSSGAVPGIYDITGSCGRALGYHSLHGLILVDPPLGTYDAFNARFDLGQASTEFGVGIGDWLGPIVLTFWNGPYQIASLVSSSYSTCNTKFFRMTNGMFDRVDVQAQHPIANWVVPEIWVETSSTCPAQFGNYGTGFPGTLGLPTLTLSARPITGTTTNLLFTSSAKAPVLSFLLYGFQKTAVPGYWGGDALVVPAGALFIPALPPGWQIAMPIPNDPKLCGQTVLFQVIQNDFGAAAGASSTSGLELVIGA